jgi:hypothetical protein
MNAGLLDLLLLFMFASSFHVFIYSVAITWLSVGQRFE